MFRKNEISRRDAVRIILVIALGAAAVILIVSAVFPVHKADPSRVETNEDRIAYLSALGWEVCSEPLKAQTITLPKEFPDVLQKYNELQKQQGFDLEKYAGKEIELYSYEVLNYPDCEDVQCSLYVYRSRVIGGDVHSASFSGFMKGLI